MSYLKQILLSLLMITTITACDKDNDDMGNGNNNNDSDTPNYQDQQVQGTLLDASFTSTYAKAQQIEFQGTKLKVQFFADTSGPSDTCFTIIGNSDLVSFTVPFSKGEHEINATNSNSSTFLRGSDSQSEIVTSGYVMISTLDTANNSVSGKVDINGGSRNNVNGTFDAYYCEN